MPIGEACALAAALCWACGSILFARIGRSVPAGAMNLGKLFAAGALLTLTRLVIAPLEPLALAPPSAHVFLALSAVAGLTIGDTAYFAAMEALGVSRAMLLLSAAPVFTTVGGALFLGERLDGATIGGIVLTIAGVVIVVFRPADPSAPRVAPRNARLGAGVALGVVAALGQASGSLLSRRAMQLGVDPLAAGAGRLVVGGIGLFVVAFGIGKARRWLAALSRERAWARVSGAAMVGSYAGIWFAQTGLARSASVGVAATLLALSPIFALPLAHMTGLERISRRAVLGAVLGVAGVAVISFSRAR